MNLPLFYLPKPIAENEIVTLPEDTAKHIVQVLRHKQNDQVQLTNGTGLLAVVTIISDHKKHCTVQVNSIHHTPAPAKNIAIGIALTKNSGRFEWFLEKATETGITEIIPLLTHRTEKQHFRFDRMNNILISAMLQSQQTWLPRLHMPALLDEFFYNTNGSRFQQRFIAHCLPEQKTSLRDVYQSELQTSLLLIGPEGDFTPEEISLAIANGFQPVALGDNRLRTETAGMVGAVLMCVR